MEVYSKESKEIANPRVITIAIYDFTHKAIWIILQLSFYIT